MKWISMKIKIPDENQKCLVWKQGNMFVDIAKYYDKDNGNAWYDCLENLPVDQRERFRQQEKASVGYFKFYGNKTNFNDNDVYWMPTPNAPKKEKK